MDTIKQDEGKPLFFAQYLGQPYKYKNEFGSFSNTVKFEYGNITGHLKNNVCYLLLRGIDSLSDEEAQEVCQIINVSYYKYIEETLRDNHNKCIMILTSDKAGDVYGGSVNIYYNGEIIWDYHNKDKWGGESTRIYAAYQYLKSIGILLPFTYLDTNNTPITLSPAKLVNRGWCKIKTN